MRFLVNLDRNECGGNVKFAFVLYKVPWSSVMLHNVYSVCSVYCVKLDRNYCGSNVYFQSCSSESITLISRVSHKPLAMNRSYSELHGFQSQLWYEHMQFSDENTVNTSEDSQNLPPRQDCSSLVWGNIAGCPCDFESPKTLEGCDSVSCSKSIVLIFWHCQKLKTQDKIEFDKIEVWQLSHFFRCQMSDDFSERGHMVNSIFGLYIMYTFKYLYHISEGNISLKRRLLII